MNIEFTGKYDAVATKRFAGKVYDRIARGMWVFGCVFFAVCAVVEALQLVSGRGFNYCLLAIAVVLFWPIRFSRARYQKNIDILSRRYFSDSEEATVVMTDDYYECRCGTNLMRVAWRNLGAYYLFVGDGVVLLMDGKVTTLLLPSLSKMSVQADELKDALARAGLKDYRKCRSCGWFVLFLVFVVGGVVVFSNLARIRPQNPQNASCIDEEDEDDDEDEDEDEWGDDFGSSGQKSFSLGDIDFDSRRIDVDQSCRCAIPDKQTSDILSGLCEHSRRFARAEVSEDRLNVTFD